MKQKHSVSKNNKAVVYGILGLQKLLRQNNLIHNKHIPTQYIISDKQQRLELIAGLMDTDGTIRPNGSMSFCNTNKRIIDDITFGNRPRRTYGGGSYRPLHQQGAEEDATSHRGYLIHVDCTKLY